MNTMNLGYSGFVDVKIKIGNKVVNLSKHNAGTDNLFLLFAKMLTNNSFAATDTPQFLGLDYKGDSTGGEWKTFLAKQISLSGKEYYYSDEFSGWAAKFSAVIVHSNLIQTITEDMDSSENSEFRLVLYSGISNDQVQVDLAYLKVSAKDLARIVPGTQAIIEWSMMVKNI